jgi:hypothetical protein
MRRGSFDHFLPRRFFQLTNQGAITDMAKKKTDEEIEPGDRLVINAPDIRKAQFILRGTSHLCVNRMSNKVRTQLQKAQSEGGAAKSRRPREAKDFDALYRAAQYRSRDGDWGGVHAACLRNAAISACRLVGFKMTLAKLAIFTLADGYDAQDGTPLIRIWGPEPDKWIAPVRNETGVIDLRSRPRWNPGEWELRPTIRFDAGILTIQDLTNLVTRIGMQVGLCEGRPDSRRSAGLEYGLFEVAQDVTVTGVAA